MRRRRRLSVRRGRDEGADATLRREHDRGERATTAREEAVEAVRGAAVTQVSDVGERAKDAPRVFAAPVTPVAGGPARIFVDVERADALRSASART